MIEKLFLSFIGQDGTMFYPEDLNPITHIRDLLAE